MSTTDLRRPAEVTRDFRLRVASALADHGFKPRKQNSELVRKHGTTIERFSLSSSHHNVPGNVTCWVGLFLEDKAVAARELGWRAGGELGGPAFAERRDGNIAVGSNADALLADIVARRAWFAMAGDATELLREVSRRYVGGFVVPSVVVPYLAERLGDDAVAAYARALLAGRPELWPGFLWRPPTTPAKTSPRPGHGTELAMMLAKHAPDVVIERPPDAVAAQDLRMANLRAWLGLQLRAWGEPAAAARLRCVDDARVKEIRDAQEAVGTRVDDPAIARLALRGVTGEPRPLARASPRPHFWQYDVLHEPFGGVAKRGARRTRRTPR